MAKKNVAPSKNDIKQALMKKALGYDSDEIVEEYVSDEEGNFKLIKKKITKKYISPDTSTAKILLDNLENENFDEYEKMSDSELEQKRKELLIELKEVKSESRTNKNKN